MKEFNGTTDEYLAVMFGEDLAEYRAKKELNIQLDEEAKIYHNAPPNDWPKLHFKWNLDSSYWHESFDGLSPHEVAENYPNGMLVGKVKLLEFDDTLCLFNKRRDNNELWSCGSQSKLSRMIAYLSHGHPISPVVVGIASDGQICLHGGNHRYTAAKFSGETDFIFICDAEARDVLDSRLSITWLSVSA